MSKGSVTMSIEKLQDLAENLKHRANVQVGVFVDKTVRPDGPLTNAALACYHENGSPQHHLPRRSMLKTPIYDHAAQIMSVFRGKAPEYLKKGNLPTLYKLIGVACEKVVLGAFQTGGYGKWPMLKYKTVLHKLGFKPSGKPTNRSVATRRKLIGQMYAGQIFAGILVRTAQLKKSFSSRVRMTY